MRDADDRRFELAALDMDGTLLDSAHRITPYTRAALSRAAEAGKLIALCTGRCMSELWAHLAALPGVAYVIGESGGCLYDVKADRLLHRVAFRDDVAFAILDAARDYDMCLQCFIDGQSYLQVPDAGALARCGLSDFEGVFRAGSVFVDDLPALARARGRVGKINFHLADARDKHEIARRLAPYDLFLADSMVAGWEISLKEASKSAGLRRLCEYLGLPLSAAMAVGDGGNDVDLMRAAGFAVAMGNAEPAVRAAADATTEDCDHDGAAKAVLRHMLGERV